MPVLTRWTIKTAMVYLILGMVSGVLYWANVQWNFWQLLYALNPIYIHMLVVGWLTQLIFGVIYWMFPIISKENLRGDPRLAWGVFALLNAGLVLRIICEPWHTLAPNDLTGYGLVLSALLQVGGVY